MGILLRTPSEKHEGGGGGGESQVTCQGLCLQQILAVHGHLATFALRLQAGGKCPCFSHPTTVALALGSLEMSSCKDLPIIFFLVTYVNDDGRIVKTIG